MTEKEYLAKILSALCKRIPNKENCDLFYYNCPAWKYGLTCGNVSYEHWLEAAKDFCRTDESQMNSVENKNLFDDIRRRCNSNWDGYTPFESLNNNELFELVTLISFAGSELEKRVSKLESENDKKYENFS